MRSLILALALAFLTLAGCHKTQEENVEVQAEKASRQLEERYNTLEAEASNDADAAAAPYDNQADALLNQIAGNVQAAPPAASKPPQR